MAIKKCKGIGKAKNFKGCGELTEYRKYGLCISGCYKDWLFSTEEGSSVLKNSMITANRKVTKKVKSKKFQEKRKWKKENKSLRSLQNDARRVFQKFIRIRDKDKTCISCGTIYARQWDGGHYLKAEIYTGLIFDELNVHKQCDSCNRFKDGNIVEYRKGLSQRFSEVSVLELEKNSNYKRDYRFNRQELLGIENLYKYKIKNINNNNINMRFPLIKISQEKRDEIIHFFKTNNNNTMPILSKKFGYSQYKISQVITEYYSTLKQLRVEENPTTD